MEQNETLNATNAYTDGIALFDLGTLLGRHLAFGLIASKCSAADAACLREIRDNKHYKALGLTWEEFCTRHAGVGRQTADRIVERLEEFGEAYFNLSQLMPIQPSGYRLLASNRQHDRAGRPEDPHHAGTRASDYRGRARTAEPPRS